MGKQILSFYLMLVCLGTVLAIDCHQCDSKNQPTCSDPYSEDNTGECGDRDTHCFKFKIIEQLYDSGFILGKPTSTVTLTRGCARMDFRGDRCRYIQAAGGFLLQCFCDADNCNSSTGLRFSLLTVLSTLLSLVLSRHWL